MIKILNEEEKLKTKYLWQNIFKEDSKSFIDYYYSIKVKNNIVFGKFVNENIVSMLHLNPYTISLNNEIIKSYYIVGVATCPENRKKGYMRNLLEESLNYMNKNKIGFTFLMPAKEEIYLPFDFRFIYNQNYLNLKNTQNIKKIPATHNDYEKISKFLNTKLKNEYELFSIRDVEYISNLHLELKSENGDILMLYNEKNNLIGLYLYWGIEKEEIRSIYSNEEYIKIIKTEPKIMARIVNVNNFLNKIFLSTNIEKTFYLNIKDDIINENNNCFKWSISQNESIISKCKNNKDEIKINISDLTSYLFGYVTLEELILNNKIYCDNANVLCDFNLIKPIKKVFLDEIV